MAELSEYGDFLRLATFLKMLIAFSDSSCEVVKACFVAAAEASQYIKHNPSQNFPEIDLCGLILKTLISSNKADLQQVD